MTAGQPIARVAPAPVKTSTRRPWTGATWTVVLLATVLRLGDFWAATVFLAKGQLMANVLLGPSPTLATRLVYLAMTLAVLWGGVNLLPPRWREGWAGLYGAVEAWTIGCSVWGLWCWTEIFPPWVHQTLLGR